MKILVISPHPDDETLGCGGTLLKYKKNGDELFWAIVTCISEQSGWSKNDVDKRNGEINSVNRKYQFSKIFNFNLPTTKLDSLPISNLVEKITKVHKEVKPEIIFMPYAHDVHTDHQVIARAVQSTVKWFRYPHIKKVLMYETVSETEFNFIDKNSFRPNVFINISEYLDNKIEIMNIYKAEIENFPFPRSEKTIRSLAFFRGSQSGFEAAEAFELVFERKS